MSGGQILLQCGDVIHFLALSRKVIEEGRCFPLETLCGRRSGSDPGNMIFLQELGHRSTGRNGF
jgi:hypothetical protein